ncbi:tagaturonate reductase [Bacillus sp. mrc49]|uniref:tagaturonate reductase n=1 Tax=Bacillus sp. mrc49 TaxID=2054913 RepID=UPI000C27EFC4|nr:tagaturonate reductase [Bacillus sp. mrc49]PJN89745.1 altronate oxidoreductase [Bacillus sp. mrc49]
MHMNEGNLKRLNRNTQAVQSAQMLHYPIKVLQIGEGNFLRGFFDWMIAESNKQGHFEGSIAVTQPRPSGKRKIEELKQQDGLYTLMMRGFHQGEEVEHTEVISVFSKVINPYEEWREFLEMAEIPTLEFVVSNTTEAGLKYQPTPFVEGEPIEAFPGRLTAFLYRRYLHFQGDPEKGLIMLPCELLERNGDSLKQCVRKHCVEWELPKSFIEWVEQDNLFLNSLVDRIVTGFPVKESHELFSSLGYEDTLLTTAEAYHLWVIEGDPALDKRLPLQQSGLNVRWVKDLAPYQLRKVRILNGLHTLMAPLGILFGLKEVKQAIEHPDFHQLLYQAIEKEIIPSLPYGHDELLEYGESVLERFANPFVQHFLSDISLNSISKFKVRLLPTLEDYHERNGKLPASIVRGFAGLLRFYKGETVNGKNIGKSFGGQEYIIQDDLQIIGFIQDQWRLHDKKEVTTRQFIEAILHNQQLWGKDLNTIHGLAEELTNHLTEMIDGDFQMKGIGPAKLNF